VFGQYQRRAAGRRTALAAPLGSLVASSALVAAAPTSFLGKFKLVAQPLDITPIAARGRGPPTPILKVLLTSRKRLATIYIAMRPSWTARGD
jgi:hypothetical protein